MSLIEQINSHKFLFLDKSQEINELELILFVNEGRVDENSESDLNEILEYAPSVKINPIVSDDKCSKYKIMFSSYLAYLVRNETFTVWDENEEFIGEGFRKYSKSRFLDYINQSTDIEYAKFLMDKEKYFHFGICCENQIIDIVSANEPIIEQLYI